MPAHLYNIKTDTTEGGKKSSAKPVSCKAFGFGVFLLKFWFPTKSSQFFFSAANCVLTCTAVT